MTTVPKLDPELAEATESTSSMYSLSDAEVDLPMLQELQAPVPKRKGGRKPIYATSEERKQRNRQAQAAFRERRTEYIKQLETTIKQHEDTLQSVQQGHRNSNDECVMLRFKVSMYERILHERGVDVHEEMRARTVSRTGGANSYPIPLATAPPPALRHRAVMNRHRKSPSLKMEQPAGHFGTSSVHSHDQYPACTSPSQASSASSNSAFHEQSILTPPASDHVPMPTMANLSHGMRTSFTNHVTGLRPISTSPAGSMVPPRSAQMHPTRPSSFYPSPYQQEIDQLEQEYDAQAEIIDDHHESGSTGPGRYPQQGFPAHQAQAPQLQGQPDRPPNQQDGHLLPPRAPAVTHALATGHLGHLGHLGDPGYLGHQGHQRHQAQLSPGRESPHAHALHSGIGGFFESPDVSPSVTGEHYEVWQTLPYPPPFSYPPTSSMR